MRVPYEHIYLTINMTCWQTVQCITYKSLTKVIPLKKSYLENLAKLSMLGKNSKIPIRLTLKMGFAYKHINRMVIPAKLQFDMF